VVGKETEAVVVESVQIIGATHDFVVEDVPHEHPRVAGVGLLDNIYGRELYCVGQLVEETARGGLLVDHPVSGSAPPKPPSRSWRRLSFAWVELDHL
jgi:hypothetical protein